MSIHGLISAITGAIVGLLVGGVLAERATEIAGVLVAWGTVGALCVAGFAAWRSWSVTQWTGYGGLAGVGVGILLVVADAVFF